MNTNMPNIPQQDNVNDETRFVENLNENLNDNRPNSNKRAIGIAAAVLSSVAAGGGIAYAITRLWPQTNDHEAEITDPVKPDLVQNRPAPQHNRINEHHEEQQHPEENDSLADSTIEPARTVDENNSEVAFLGTEHTTIEGQEVTVGYMTINGNYAIMVDTDNDGVFDTLCYDQNGDGNLQENEITQLPTNGENAMTVAQFQHESGQYEEDYTHNANNQNAEENPDVELIGIHETVDGDGNQITVAGVTVGNEELSLVDVDHDGKFDYMARDLNGDGKISADEIFEIDSDITVEGVASLPQNENYRTAYDAEATNTAANVTDGDGVLEADDIEGHYEQETEVSGDEDLSYLDEDSTIEQDIDQTIDTDDFGTLGDDGINV